jgi:hypothetical protein
MNLLLLISGILLSFSVTEEDTSLSIATAQQPQIAINSKGVIRIAFGRTDSIFCLTSLNNGQSFSTPAFVGKVPDMHLGMTRGPQIASSANLSMISSMDENGDIHSFILDDKTNIWKRASLVNDVRGSAPEGLMALAADESNNFYAVWLDTRKDKKNNIYFSSFSSRSRRWSSNTLVYSSPDEHVCECCKPSIAVHGSKVAVMFRNWLNGSRDLYMSVSSDKGNRFDKAIKLGEGTWKLNGCPMDGGGLSFDDEGNIHTVWRREGSIYYAQPHKTEVEIAKGKLCSISSGKGKGVIALQDEGVVKVIDLKTRKETVVGKGSFLKTFVMKNGEVICAWEDGETIKVSVI